MGELALLENIGIMIVASAVVVLVGRHLRVPNIVLYIVTGLLLGPVLGVVQIDVAPPEAIEVFYGPLGVVAEVGITLLLFLVGLELTLSKVRDVGKVALLTGVGQLAVTAVLGVAVTTILGFGWVPALFIAFALTNSSTVLVVKLLDQKGETNSVYGHIAVGANLIKDLALVVVLTIIAGLNFGEDLVMGEVAIDLATTFAGLAGLLVGAMAVAKYVLPFEWAARSPEMMVIWSLSWCFALAVMAASLGLSPAIGAFVAGIALAQLPASDDLRRRVHPLMSFFLALFFVAIGARMELGDATAYWPTAVILSVLVLVVNPLVCVWLIRKCGYTTRTAFYGGMTMGQISELSFIFAAVGLDAGLIDSPAAAMVTLVGLVTIAVSSYMILYSDQLYAITVRWRLMRYFGEPEDAVPERQAPELRDHVVVVGMNAMGRQIVAALADRGEAVLAIDTDARKLRNLPAGVRMMIGSVDHMSVVEEAQLAAAKLVVSTLHIEDTNNLLAYRCKRMGVPVAIHAFDRSVIGDLRRLDVDHLIDPKARWVADLTEALESSGIAAGDTGDTGDARGPGGAGGERA